MVRVVSHRDRHVGGGRDGLGVGEVDPRRRIDSVTIRYIAPVSR